MPKRYALAIFYSGPCLVHNRQLLWFVTITYSILLVMRQFVSAVNPSVKYRGVRSCVTLYIDCLKGGVEEEGLRKRDTKNLNSRLCGCKVFTNGNHWATTDTRAILA